MTQVFFVLRCIQSTFPHLSFHFPLSIPQQHFFTKALSQEQTEQTGTINHTCKGKLVCKKVYSKYANKKKGQRKTNGSESPRHPLCSNITKLFLSQNISVGDHHRQRRTVGVNFRVFSWMGVKERNTEVGKEGKWIAGPCDDNISRRDVMKVVFSCHSLFLSLQ